MYYNDLRDTYIELDKFNFEEEFELGRDYNLKEVMAFVADKTQHSLPEKFEGDIFNFMSTNEFIDYLIQRDILVKTVVNHYVRIVA